mmetsp:Transcript_54798/g.142666  ORF Transcript_54798/g.142666 Transcript_54798/m.142666 type:complete len:290 (-) Transcript_54798:37-906(-)
MAGGQVQHAPKAEQMGLLAPWEAELQDYQRSFASGSGEACTEKVIFFMRHAESTSNVHKRNLSRRPCAACQLCSVGFDAPLSQAGLLQLEEVRPACQRLLPELEAIFHSPLQRARQTAQCTFGAENGPGDFSGGEPQSPVPWVPLLCLKEEQFEEHIQEPGCNVFGGHRMREGVVTNSDKFRRRIEHFLQFVWTSRFQRIALVGHSLWFRALIDIAADAKESAKLANASVWQLTLSPPEAAGAVPKIARWSMLFAPAGKLPGKEVELASTSGSKGAVDGDALKPVSAAE